MISGFLMLLEKHETHLDEKSTEYIRYAVDGAMRMSQLIHDLLEYSRVDRKGRALQPVDAGWALAGALANLQRAIQDAGATITYDGLPMVMGDLIQLTQLFQNLIGNAIKFRSPERPCRVKVGVQKKDAQWEFLVKDNGIGIDPSQGHRIFVIFQRLHTRDKYPGTGIGLAICKRIVERHGGRIWVDSETGKGSSFCFSLNPGVPHEFQQV